MLLHHVVSKSKHIWGCGRKSNLSQVYQVPQQIPSNCILHVSKQPQPSWIGLRRCLYNLVQKYVFIKRQDWEWPAPAVRFRNDSSIWYSRPSPACNCSWVNLLSDFLIGQDTYFKLKRTKPVFLKQASETTTHEAMKPESLWIDAHRISFPKFTHPLFPQLLKSD